MNLSEAKEILRQPPCFGSLKQIEAKQFMERAQEAANTAMKLVGEDYDLVKAILWLIKKRWNERCGVNQFL